MKLQVPEKRKLLLFTPKKGLIAIGSRFLCLAERPAGWGMTDGGDHDPAWVVLDL